MKGRLIREDERNVRSEMFLKGSAADFAANSIWEAKIDGIIAANVEVAGERHNQLSGEGAVREHYDIYEDAFDEMVREMETVRDFAAFIGQTTPGFETKFRIPRSSKSGMLAAAYVFADDGEEAIQSFTTNGLDEHFVSRLRAKADAAKHSADDAKISEGKKVGATKALAANVKICSALVESMRPIVKFVYRDNPSKLAEWEHASRVERHTPVPRPPDENK